MTMYWLFILRNATNRYVHLPHYKQRDEGHAVYNTIESYPIFNTVNLHISINTFCLYY